MNYLSRKDGARIPWTRVQTVERLRVGMYSKTRVDLDFKHNQGSELREVFLELSIDEAEALAAELTRAVEAAKRGES